jgi:hypothetical protein
MDKKDIYEHLAKVYLDGSPDARKNRKRTRFSNTKKLIFISFVLVCVFSFIIALFLRKGASNIHRVEVSLVLNPGIAKINFRFPPARQEIYTLDLNQLNLSGCKNLAFSIKKENYKDNISLKIEFTNSFKEKSEIFIRDIPDVWKEYKIALSEFKKITDWSEMSNLSFIVEEWNSQEKKDIVYIENIRLLR